MDSLRSLSRLSDQDLLASLEVVARRSHRVTAELIAHIAEVDRRKLYREEACSSMFAYCTERLGLSEDAAAKRIQVARAARRFPALLEVLAQGEVHLTGLRLLVPHLTEENYLGVIRRAEGMSKRKIEELVAELSPQPDVPSKIRKLPAPKTQQAKPTPAAAPIEAPLLAEPAPSLLPPRHPTASSHVEPLAPARYKIEFTVDQALHDKIEKARELLRHRVPDGDLVAAVDQAFTLLVDKLEKERFGSTKSPRKCKQPSSESSRHIPNSVKREVYTRDGGQCTFVDAQGRRCTEKGMLEYDHIVPFAMGGNSTTENLRLRCWTHNQLHAEQSYGTAFMEQKRLFN
jgi:hypothetical protein